MSLHGYGVAIELRNKDVPFYSLIMAAMLKADTINTYKLREMWPDVWDELQERYNAPGGKIPSDDVPVEMRIVEWNPEAE